MKEPRIDIITYPKNALNPGGIVYALYKVYPKAKWSTGHIGRTKNTVLSESWFVGYMRAKEDYLEAIKYLEERENDGPQIRYELREVSDYRIPEYLIKDAKRDRERAIFQKIVGRLRRKHPSADEIKRRKELSRWKRRMRRYEKLGKEPPKVPLNRRTFPVLFDMRVVRPDLTGPEGIRHALRYLYD